MSDQWDDEAAPRHALADEDRPSHGQYTRVEGGATKPDGGWVEGSGWRMKAPEEKRRQRVVRGLQAAERVERERQARRASGTRAYTTPPQGQAVSTMNTMNGMRGTAATRAENLGANALRAARIRSERTRKLERKKDREERDRRIKAEEDALIQRKLDKARSNQEKLEAKQRRENAQLKQAVRVSWQQRPPSNIDRPQSGFDATIRKGILRVSDADGQLEDPDLVESQQMEAAVRSSLADLGRGGLAGLAPPAPVATPAARDRVYATGHDYPEDPDPDFAESRQMEAAARNSLADLGRGGAAGVAPRAPDAAPSYGAEMPLLVVHPAGSRGASGDRARGQEIAQHWDSVLDGAAIPAGLAADTGVGPNEESGDWDGVLAEAISVVEWDLPDEISSEARREGFRRNMLVLLGDAVERNGHRVRVRNGNSTFQANIGRWACGRRLMRLAGFFLKLGTAQGATADTETDDSAQYAWVTRVHRSKEHLAMLRSLVKALEEKGATGTKLGTGSGRRGSSSGKTERAAPPENPDDLMSYAFAAGFQLTPPLRLGPAARPQDEFSRIREEQDKAFEEALRQDRAASAGKEAKAIATAGKIAQPVDFGAKEDTQGGLSLGGARVDLTSQEGETAAQRRAKIAQSFARLGLGS